MGTAVSLLLRLVLFMLFVFLVQQFWAVLEVNGCLDGGGKIENGFCINDQYGRWAMASARHYVSWFMVLGIPAAVIWLLQRVIAFALLHYRSRS